MIHAVEVKSAYKSFAVAGQQTHVLKGLNYTLPTGAFHAIMGPSGSGKTTLANLIAGLLAVDSGDILIGGQSLAGLSDDALTRFRRRHIGIIFQSFNLIPTLTVAENVALPALLDHTTLPAETIDELLDQVGLLARRDHPADRLSGGEAQRTAIARALAMQSDVILADEPTGNLDSAAGRDFCELLTHINNTRHTSIILVSHDPVVASAASEIFLLKDGAFCGSFATNHDPHFVSETYLQRLNQSSPTHRSAQ